MWVPPAFDYFWVLLTFVGMVSLLCAIYDFVQPKRFDLFVVVPVFDYFAFFPKSNIWLFAQNFNVGSGLFRYVGLFLFMSLCNQKGSIFLMVTVAVDCLFDLSEGYYCVPLSCIVSHICIFLCPSFLSGVYL